MLHALLADHTEFLAVREELAGYARVILPDARGHGASPTLQNQWYSVAELADDVMAVLDAEEITAAHMVGHDLGGTVAFELARRYPERIRSLALIEPELGSVLDADTRGEIRAARAERRTNDRNVGDAAYKNLVDRSLDGYLGPRWGNDWRASIAKPRMGAIRRHAAALAGIVPALDAYQITPADVRGIAAPALLLLGDDAGLIERTVAARLSEWLPHVALRSASLGRRADGSFRDERSVALAQVLMAFWTSLEGGDRRGRGDD